MFYFSKINNPKIHSHLLVNQKGLHLEYIKYISYGTPWLKKSHKTYISLLISPLLFDLLYLVDVKIDLEEILKPWSINSLHCNFLVLIDRLMWYPVFKICNIFIHPNLLDPTDLSLQNRLLGFVSCSTFLKSIIQKVTLICW